MITPTDPRTSNVTPPMDQPEAEGHGLKRGAKPETDPASEVEGHAARRATPEIDEAEDEVEGHVKSSRAKPGDDEPEVAGHIAKSGR